MRGIALSLGLIVLAACSPPSQPAASTATSAAPETTIPASVEPVTPEGYRGVRIGMTLRQAETVLGQAIQPDGNDEDSEACVTFHIGEGDPRTEASFMAENGHVTRVSFYGPAPPSRTPEGVGVGSSDAQVRAAYAGRVIEQPAKYDDPPAHDLIVWTTPQTAGYRFEVGQDGKVNALHAGGPSILYVEGCA